ncbi:MAG: hypothetical protein HND44_12845 [Chloroflexi bacterium]|nr:hypothetical protein [Ardenticatenaceae bacterium]MBL1129366.1 hypothetical protein [Chloroflexota bacterium]NOG35445.1 hypothetical protein [Chloroflexota bacterium]GIK55310.1 MAG: hypothetical protein BroJett015_09730 [Chloroflexota bacterium]
MTETIDISHEPDLGYVFYPATAENNFGSTRFDVILSEHPTRRHYDPENVQVTIARQTHVDAIHLNYTAPPAQFRVCPGRIVLTDRVHKQVSAFCFGGDLRIIHQPPDAICVFQSPVSILDITTYHSAHMLFANEVEILIAERRAAWDPHHPHQFEQHLAQVDPTLLYAACLDTLATKFAAMPHSNDPARRQFVHLLQKEIKSWQQNGRWPLAIPKLTELL